MFLLYPTSWTNSGSPIEAVTAQKLQAQAETNPPGLAGMDEGLLARTLDQLRRRLSVSALDPAKTYLMPPEPRAF